MNGRMLQDGVESQESPPACPKCGAFRTAEIVWGFIYLEQKDERDLADGRIVLGGCCLTDDDPKWRCGQCGAEWGRADHCDATNRRPKRRGVALFLSNPLILLLLSFMIVAVVAKILE